MPLATGVRLGPYQVVSPIGAGGMGEVYRARDTKLNRDVALKILPTEFALDADRLARFKREAQVLASLNHPNIAAIYGFEDSDAQHALILELVEGPTLADRIARGPLPLDEALPITYQIADAIEAAHAQGIIHRDLKPANIKISPAGTVKVLDFGLAKLVETETLASSMTVSPTLSVHATHAGIILGTAAYMSPEQARGRAVDKRTDVWAFGCVLFEMLAGTPAFDVGDTISDAVAVILKGEPNWSALPVATPAPIRKVLRRCLQKDPHERFHDIADVRIELKDASREPAEPQPPVVVPSMRRESSRGLVWVFSAFAAGVLMAGFGIWMYAPRPRTPEVSRFLVSPPDKTAFQTGLNLSASGVISPDGRRLVFTARDDAGKVQIWLRPIDSLTAQPLAATDNAAFPFWSADGRSVGYFAQEKLFAISAAGGPPRLICSAPQARGGTWSRGGVIVFGTQGGSLQRVSASGGQPVPVTQHLATQTDHRFPSFLPDGQHVLFYAIGSSPETTGVYVASLDPGEPKQLAGADTAAVYAPEGYLLFGRQGTLLAQRFNLSNLQLSGDPLPVAQQLASSFYGGLPSFSVADDGTLAYGIGSNSLNTNLQLAWYDRQGKLIENVGATANYRGLDLSPDGTRAAVHRHEGGGPGGDIWLMGRGTNVRLTFDPAGENTSPIWSPDGTWIAFASNRSGKAGLYRKRSDLGGGDELLMEADTSVGPTSWSPDGSLVYRRFDPKTGYDLWLLPLAGERKPVALLVGPSTEVLGQVSPDGKWLAYSSTETAGRNEIYVRPFPTGDGQHQISSTGGIWPRWRRDGRELFYADNANDGKLMAVEITTSGTTFESGPPRALFDTKFLVGGNHNSQEYFGYAVSPDGQRFLIPRPVTLATDAPSPDPMIAVVLDWSASLEK